MQRWKKREGCVGVSFQRPAPRSPGGTPPRDPPPSRPTAGCSRRRRQLPGTNNPNRRGPRYATSERDRVPAWKIAASRAAPVRERQTRIRLIDGYSNETVGIIWTRADADDEHIRSLIPEGMKAMVARNVWP